MDNKEWLAQLESGDEVVVRRHLREDRLVKVEKITTTQIVAANQRFRRLDGRSIGDSGRFITHSWLVEPTDELRDKIERSELLHTFSHTGIFDKLSLGKLREIDAILKE